DRSAAAEAEGERQIGVSPGAVLILVLDIPGSRTADEQLPPEQLLVLPKRLLVADLVHERAQELVLEERRSEELVQVVGHVQQVVVASQAQAGRNGGRELEGGSSRYPAAELQRVVVANGEAALLDAEGRGLQPAIEGRAALRALRLGRLPRGVLRRGIVRWGA